MKRNKHKGSKGSPLKKVTLSKKSLKKKIIISEFIAGSIIIVFLLLAINMNEMFAVPFMFSIFSTVIAPAVLITLEDKTFSKFRKDKYAIEKVIDQKFLSKEIHNDLKHAIEYLSKTAIEEQTTIEELMKEYHEETEEPGIQLFVDV